MLCFNFSSNEEHVSGFSHEWWKERGVRICIHPNENSEEMTKTAVASVHRSLGAPDTFNTCYRNKEHREVPNKKYELIHCNVSKTANKKRTLANPPLWIGICKTNSYHKFEGNRSFNPSLKFAFYPCKLDLILEGSQAQNCHSFSIHSMVVTSRTNVTYMLACVVI